LENHIFILFFIIGLIFGSFFVVIGLRLPKQESFGMNRSYCISCNKHLQWYELIPVLSFVFLKGKCNNCNAPISCQYPLIEIITGLLFAISYWSIGINLELMIVLLLHSMLVIALVSDLTYMIIPNTLLLFFLPLFIILRSVEPLTPWWSPLIGGLAGLIIPLVIIIISRGGMGVGDAKLFALIGFVIGIKKLLLCFFLACIIGAFLGLVLIMLKQIKRKQPVPFVPSILLATWITYYFGDYVLDWYLSSFMFI
jgi:leader peptidase (prepilin peptidase) / N-methyltransferase